MPPLEKLSVSDNLKQIFLEIGEEKESAKDSMLFSEGEDATHRYIVKAGLIKVGKLSQDGREISIRLCREGDFVGEISLYSELKRLLNAQVVKDSRILVIDKKSLEEKLLKKSKLAIELIQLMNDMSRRDQMRIYDLISHGKKGALFSTLIRLSNSYGKITEDGILIDMPLTNQEIANFCGKARESVNRSLNQLRKDQVISIDKGFITIKDLEYLREEINCEVCPVGICTIH